MGNELSKQTTEQSNQKPLQQKNGNNRFRCYLNFGLSISSKQVRYLNAIDLKKQIIRLYYINIEDNLNKLFQQYIQNQQQTEFHNQKKIILRNTNSHNIVSDTDTIQSYCNRENQGILQMIYQEQYNSQIYIQNQKTIKGSQYYIQITDSQIMVKQIYKSPRDRKFKLGQIFNQKISVAFLQQNRNYQFKLQQIQTIKYLKQKLSQLTHVPQQQQILFYNSIFLKDYQRLSFYGSFNQGLGMIILIRATFQKRQKYLKYKVITKNIELKINHFQKVKFNYLQYSQLFCKEIISHFSNSFRPAFCLAFNQKLLKPHFKLLQIQQQNYLFQKEKIECNLIKGYDKVIFIEKMKEKKLKFDDYFKSSQILKKQRFQRKQKQIVKKIKKFQFRRGVITDIQQLCKSILIYTSDIGFHRDLNELLRMLAFCQDQNITDESKYKFCSSLIYSLRQFQNYIGTVHRGIQNFRFSNYFMQKQCFYFNSFTSTSKKCNVAQKYAVNGTLLHIQCLTGKDIQLFSDFEYQQQVLMIPFTYYIVDKIKKGTGKFHDEVWLSQLSSPQTFEKDNIVWIDNKPKNNIQIIKIIEKQNNIQVMQIPNIRMSMIWFEQFQWVLDWKKLQVKLVYKIQDDQIRNQKIINQILDEIQLFQNFYGRQIPILILSSQKDIFNQYMKKRINLIKYQINVTDKTQDILQFTKSKIKII